MTKLRDSPPLKVAGNSVVKITDYLFNTITYVDKSFPNKVGPGLPASNVISIELEDRTRIIARPSGTEPKIRIMGESKNKALLKKCIKTVTRTIN